MPDSNSKQFIRRLRDAIDEREPIDTPEFRAEAVSNEVNRAAWRRYALLESAVEETRDRQPTVDLGEAVLTALRSSAPNEATVDRAVSARTADTIAESRRRFGRMALALSTIAALVLFALLTRPPRDTASQPIAVAPDRSGNDGDAIANGGSQPIPEPVPEQQPEAEIDELLADATAAYRGLARETRFAFADLALFVPDFKPNDAEVPMPPMETDEGWAPPSLRNGFDRTLDLLIENSDEATRT